MSSNQESALDRNHSKDNHIRGWWVCSLAALFYCYEYLLRIEPNVMETALRQHYHLSADGLGWLLASYFYAYTPLQLFVGFVLDRLGCHRVLTLALFACVGGCSLFAAGDTIWLTVLGRWLLGAGSAFAFIGILRLGALWLPRNQFSFYVGLTTALGMLGAIFGEMALGDLVKHFSATPVLFMSAFMGLVLVPFFYFYVREPKQQLKPADNFNSDDQSILKSLVSSKFLSSSFFFRILFYSFCLVAGMWGIPWLQSHIGHNTIWASNKISVIFTCLLIGLPVFRWLSALVRLIHPKFLSLGFVSCILFCSLSVVAGVWGIPWLQARTGHSTVWASHEISAIFTGWLIGSPLFGWLSARMRARRKPLLVGLAISIVCFSLLLMNYSFSSIALWALLFGYGFGSSAQVICFAMASDWASKKNVATALAMINFMVMLSGMLLQPLIAQCLDWSWQGKIANSIRIYSTHSYTLAMSVLLAFLCFAFIVMLTIPESFTKIQEARVGKSS